MAPAWEEALAAARPCVVEFLTDPAVPPIPPHATWDQLEKALESIVRGDSDRVDVIKEGVRRRSRSSCPVEETIRDNAAADTRPLSDEELEGIDAYWRAANYLSVGQIYLLANPLLRGPLPGAHQASDHKRDAQAV